jgi:hypothetical protein
VISLNRQGIRFEKFLRDNFMEKAVTLSTGNTLSAKVQLNNSPWKFAGVSLALLNLLKRSGNYTYDQV